MILLVEDNDALRDASLAFFASQGLDSKGVSCVEDMDEVVREIPPEIYVLDLNLPGEDGLSLARRIRSIQPDAAIIVTSARSDIDSRVECYQAGANMYLPKPVDPLELSAAIKSLQERNGKRQDSLSGLALDSRLRALRGPCAETRLSEAEVRLLSALALAKDHYLERWQVSVQFGSPEASISRDSLQNRISQLRKKIEPCLPGTDVIRSVRKEGYRLCVALKIV